jgi:alpha-L-fucosidase
MPDIPAPLPVGSVPLGDATAFPEVKLDFPIAEGPFEPTWESIERNYPGTPAWLREAKFGIWVHFGPQAAGRSGDWYARRIYLPGTQAYGSHLRHVGHPSVSGYKEVLRDWNPDQLDPAALVDAFTDAGARFVMIQGVHHDNFDLWNSRHQPWNATRLGPKRDLLGEWVRALRNSPLRYGVTFHHEYTWWWWQAAFENDREGPMAGVPYDGHLTAADGVGQWWEGLDPRLLYGVDLREYESVLAAARSAWNVPEPGIFARHLDYARWYATWWAVRMTDVIDRYDPDLIYTDGNGQGPFHGEGTGTGYKCDAIQRVMAHLYNRALERRGTVDTFSVIKFRHATNGTVTTEEHGIPENIVADQPWIAEAPVGDWYYAPNFVYDAGMMIRYLLEAVSRDGNACICVSPRPDGSLDDGSRAMLREVGVWMRANGQGIYGSKAWSIPGEGEIVNGRLRQLPGGKLGREHAEFQFGPQDFRFTVGSDGALYAYCMTVPEAGTVVTIRSLRAGDDRLGRPVRSVQLLGAPEATPEWAQAGDGLRVTVPATEARVALGFRIG